MESTSHAPMSKDAEENKLIAAIGYLGILCLLPLLLKKDSPFAQFHGKQGLVLLIVSLLLWAGNIVPFVGSVVWLVGSLGVVILIIMGIVHALRGEMWELPYLGQYAKEIKL